MKALKIDDPLKLADNILETAIGFAAKNMDSSDPEKNGQAIEIIGELCKIIGSNAERLDVLIERMGEDKEFVERQNQFELTAFALNQRNSKKS